MIHRIAEYRILAGEGAPVTEAVAEFVAAVRAHEPETRYEAYRRGEGLDFIHFMTFPDADAEERHRRASYTARFVEILYPRCEAPPDFTRLFPVVPSEGPPDR